MQVCLSRVFTVPRGRLLCYIWSYMGSWFFPGSPLTHKTWFKICSSLGNAARTERKSLRIIMRENKPAQFFWTNKMAVNRNGNHVPCRPLWILKRFVSSVFIHACRLLSALPSLSQFGRGRLSLVAISCYALSLLFEPCRLSEFTLAGPQIKYDPEQR